MKNSRTTINLDKLEAKEKPATNEDPWDLQPTKPTYTQEDMDQAEQKVRDEVKEMVNNIPSDGWISEKRYILTKLEK